MKILLTFKLILLSAFVFCQDLQNLDKKMGFNKFKLESKFDNYKAQLSLLTTDKDGVKFYEYSSNDIPHIFGIPFKNKITLGFYKNLLYSISIGFTYTTENDDLILQEKFKNLFGYTAISYDQHISNISNYEWVMQWDAKRALLQVGKHKLNSEFPLPWTTEIFMVSKKIQSEILNDSF
jgi:hypothetical protein